MDDLTKINGISAATARKLTKAGIETFAQLAAATNMQLEAAKVPNPADWQAWISGAATLAAPPMPRQLTAEEVSALVKAWDEARAELQAAGDAASAAQYQLDTAEEGSDRAPLEQALAEAKARVTAAHDTIAALAPLPEGVRLPDATTNTAIPAGPQGNVDGQAGNDTQPHQQTAQGPEEGSAKDAPLETGAVAGASEFLSPAVRDALVQKAADRGQTLDELFADSLKALAAFERDDLMNDLSADDGELDEFVEAHTGRQSVTVIGPVAGRRRAGFTFGAVPQTVDVTPEQLAEIKSDASLSVSHGALPPRGDVDAVRQRLSDADFSWAGPVGRVTVIGPARGRRRAGFEFGASPVTIEVNRDQLASILSDDGLAVTPA